MQGVLIASMTPKGLPHGVILAQVVILAQLTSTEQLRVFDWLEKKDENRSAVINVTEASHSKAKDSFRQNASNTLSMRR